MEDSLQRVLLGSDWVVGFLKVEELCVDFGGRRVRLEGSWEKVRSQLIELG
jgi:hypothetical protein